MCPPIPGFAQIKGNNSEIFPLKWCNHKDFHNLKNVCHKVVPRSPPYYNCGLVWHKYELFETILNALCIFMFKTFWNASIFLKRQKGEWNERNFGRFLLCYSWWQYQQSKYASLQVTLNFELDRMDITF